LSIELTELLPFAHYVVVMAAATQAGVGNFTSPLEERTRPDGKDVHHHGCTHAARLEWVKSLIMLRFLY